MRKFLTISAILSTLVLSACSTQTGSPSGSDAPGSTDDSDSPADSAVDVVEEVVAFEFGYTPSDLAYRPGEVVQINLTNDGDGRHDFVIEELDLGTEIIGPGEKDSFTFVMPDEELTFYCSVPGHRELGMEGVISVKAS